MAAPTKTTFLERAGYRRRRMRDVGRATPVFGAILFVIPLLWQRNGEGAYGTADAVIYIFVVWSLLIAITAAISRILERNRSKDD